MRRLQVDSNGKWTFLIKNKILAIILPEKSVAEVTLRAHSFRIPFKRRVLLFNNFLSSKCRLRGWPSHDLDISLQASNIRKPDRGKCNPISIR